MSKKFAKTILTITILILLLTMILICSNCNYQTKKGIESINYNNSQTTVINSPTSDQSITATRELPILNPNSNISTSTPTLDPYDLGVTLPAANGTIWAPTMMTEKNEFLYKDAIIKMRMYTTDTTYFYSKTSYLNLDDLSDNDMQNSDIEVNISVEDEEMLLQPINNAYYYYPGKETMDLSSCKEYFPLEEMDQFEYGVQGTYFWKGYSYCVLTNEKRIAIVNYLLNSFKDYYQDGSVSISLRITVYDTTNQY